jgi:predicted DNA-binding transcriptional regulator AlpA
MTTPRLTTNPTTSTVTSPRAESPASPPPALTMLTVPEAARILGIGRTLAYELVRTDSWPTPVIRAGRLIRIPSGPLLALLATGQLPA